MTLSPRSFLKVWRHFRAIEGIDGLVGRATLPADTAPNAKPWHHLDLSKFRESVNALLGYRPIEAARRG